MALGSLAATPPGAGAARRAGAKTVSFAATVKLSNERLPGSPSFLARQGKKREAASASGTLSELFMLLLLLALALLAPAGQEIAHVNDIILLYVGYTSVSFLCQSLDAPISELAKGTTSGSGRRRTEAWQWFPRA